MTLKIALDTCCWDKKSIPQLKELINLKNQGSVEIYTDTITLYEKDGWISSEKSEIIELINSNSIIKIDAGSIPSEIAQDPKRISEYFDQLFGYTLEELTEANKKINSILHPEGLKGKKWRSHYADGKILAKSIARRIDIFVTKDKGFFKKNKKEKLETEFPQIKIRILDERLINELKHQI